MLVLVTYDVSTKEPGGSTRLQQVAKKCTAHGQRVQNSVFECSLSEEQFCKFRKELEQLIDKEKDSLRFYTLGNQYAGKVIHIGAKQSYLPNDVLIL